MTRHVRSATLIFCMLILDEYLSRSDFMFCVKVERLCFFFSCTLILHPRTWSVCLRRGDERGDEGSWDMKLYMHFLVEHTCMKRPRS